MKDSVYRICFLGILYLMQFGFIYLYGRKSFPKRAAQLAASAWIIMMLITYYSTALGIFLSVVVMISLVFVLKKPDGSKALQQFYTANKIYSSRIFSQAAADILGDKKWTFAEGTLSENSHETGKYLLWQGYTSSTVATGTNSHTTVFTNYLAFIFPPGSVSNAFKQNALAAGDKSRYTFKQRIKFFFVPDMDTPCRVATATDGSFIIEYITIPDVEHYSKRLAWIKENYSKLYFAPGPLSHSMHD